MTTPPVLQVPTTKAQRAEFAGLDECDRMALAMLASKLYDGTRTVSACWRETFDRWHAVAAGEMK